MKIREITAEDRYNPRILDALNQIVGRAEKEIACVLIEPEHGEDLVIRPDIPQFNQNIVGKTQAPVIKVSSSNNIADTQIFEHIQTIDGMYVWAFYNIEKPAIYTMTSGPIIGSVSTEKLAEAIESSVTTSDK